MKLFRSDEERYKARRQLSTVVFCLFALYGPLLSTWADSDARYVVIGCWGLVHLVAIALAVYVSLPTTQSRDYESDEESD